MKTGYSSIFLKEKWKLERVLFVIASASRHIRSSVAFDLSYISLLCIRMYDCQTWKKILIVRRIVPNNLHFALDNLCHEWHDIKSQVDHYWFRVVFILTYQHFPPLILAWSLTRYWQQAIYECNTRDPGWVDDLTRSQESPAKGGTRTHTPGNPDRQVWKFPPPPLLTLSRAILTVLHSLVRLSALRFAATLTSAIYAVLCSVWSLVVCSPVKTVY